MIYLRCEACFPFYSLTTMIRVLKMYNIVTFSRYKLFNLRSRLLKQDKKIENLGRTYHICDLYCGFKYDSSHSSDFIVAGQTKVV